MSTTNNLNKKYRLLKEEILSLEGRLLALIKEAVLILNSNCHPPLTATGQSILLSEIEELKNLVNKS
jgi:hypothetical protein